EVRNAAQERLPSDLKAVGNLLAARGRVDDHADLVTQKAIDGMGAALAHFWNELGVDALLRKVTVGPRRGDHAKPQRDEATSEIDHARLVGVTDRDEDVLRGGWEHDAGRDLTLREGDLEALPDAHHLTGGAHLGSQEDICVREPREGKN